MPPKRKRTPVRELITYPTVEVTTENDPCLQPSEQFHHVLDCGRLVTTRKPREPCAPNCRHIAAIKASQKKERENLQTSGLPYYCDACIEIANEPQIHVHFSNQEAEDQRAVLRREIATKQNKASKYRKCYIAQKLICVPCDEDGDVVNGYSPIVRGHRYDNALPRTGTNMFEDLDTPCRGKAPNPFTPSTKSSPPTVSLDDDVYWEDVDDTVAEGMKWVREEGDRARRRAFQHTTPGQRAAARPVIPSGSSSDTGLSSFVINSSSPSTAQFSSPSAPTVAQNPARQNSNNKRKKPIQGRPRSPHATPTQVAKAAQRTTKSVQAAGRTSHNTMSAKKGQHATSTPLRVLPSHKKSPKKHPKRL